MMKKTICTEWKTTTETLTSNSLITREEHKRIIKNIHTGTVAETLRNYSPNKVIRCPSLPINPTEKLLSRKTRTELARLRSGYSRNLNSYLNRIDPEIPDRCPRCSTSPHNTNHLFNCPANPTHLNPTDLWIRPNEAADFLGLIEDPGD